MKTESARRASQRYEDKTRKPRFCKVCRHLITRKSRRSGFVTCSGVCADVARKSKYKAYRMRNKEKIRTLGKARWEALKAKNDPLWRASNRARCKKWKSLNIERWRMIEARYRRNHKQKLALKAWERNHRQLLSTPNQKLVDMLLIQRSFMVQTRGPIEMRNDPR